MGQDSKLAWNPGTYGWITQTTLCVIDKEHELPRGALMKVSLGNCQLRESRTHVAEASGTQNSWA